MQGIDYFYTLQGFIKGVNGNSNDVKGDFGADGDSDGCAPVQTGYVTGEVTYDCSDNNNFGSNYT